MSKVFIYHNPQCSKSRQTLALIREQEIEPNVIEYLKTPPDVSTIQRWVSLLGVEPDELIREKEFRQLKVLKPDNPSELIELMASHPQIIQRPIVVSGSKACVGRPPENVLKIL